MVINVCVCVDESAMKIDESQEEGEELLRNKVLTSVTESQAMDKTVTILRVSSSAWLNAGEEVKVKLCLTMRSPAC